MPLNLPDAFLSHLAAVGWLQEQARRVARGRYGSVPPWLDECTDLGVLCLYLRMDPAAVRYPGQVRDSG